MKLSICIDVRLGLSRMYVWEAPAGSPIVIVVKDGKDTDVSTLLLEIIGHEDVSAGSERESMEGQKYKLNKPAVANDGSEIDVSALL